MALLIIKIRSEVPTEKYTSNKSCRHAKDMRLFFWANLGKKNCNGPVHFPSC